VAADTAQFSQVVSTGITNSGGRLFNADLSLVNTVGLITNISFVYTNTGGRMPIFAVSASAGAVVPFPTLAPVDQRTYPGSNISFIATFGGTTPITYRWQKGTNGVFVNLSNGGNVSGATTTNLNLATVDVPDDADYRLTATNVAGNASTAIAHLLVLDTNQCITVPGDTISSAGGSDAGGEGVLHAIDNDVSKWLNFGGNGGQPFLGRSA